MKSAFAVLFAALLPCSSCSCLDECNDRFYEHLCVGPTTWGECLPGLEGPYTKGPTRWKEEECAAGTLCVAPEPFDAGPHGFPAVALCSYSPIPTPECQGRDRYCDSPTSETKCEFGYPIERRACATCTNSSGNSTCEGYSGDTCSASEPCALGFACIHFDGRTPHCLGELGAECPMDEACAPGLSCSGPGATASRRTCQ